MHASSIIAGWVFICAHVHATDPGGGADGNAGELSEYQRGFNAGVKAGLSKETAKVLFKKGYEACEAAAAGSPGNQGDSPRACKCDVPVPGDNAEAGRRKRLAVAFKVKPNFAPYDDDITYDFATPVLNTHLHLPADVHAGLRDEIHAQMLAAPVWEVSRSTKGKGAWRSEEILKWKSAHVEHLGKAILQRMHRVFLLWNDGRVLPSSPSSQPRPCREGDLMPGIGSECLGPGAVFEAELTMWAQALPAGGHNIVHKHQLDERSRNGRWSGVYYVAVPPCPPTDQDCGALEYFDTRGEQPTKGISDIRPLEYTRLVHPKPGELLVFPADVRHKVRPFAGDGFRLSIAFNVNIERSHATGSREAARYGANGANGGKVVCTNCAWTTKKIGDTKGGQVKKTATNATAESDANAAASSSSSDGRAEL